MTSSTGRIAPKASGCGSLDLGYGLTVLREREDVPDVLRPVMEHEHELGFADRPEVANTRAVQTVVVHPLELRVDRLLRHAQRRIGPLDEVGGVRRAERCRVLAHPRRGGAAAPESKIRDLTPHL